MNVEKSEIRKTRIAIVLHGLQVSGAEVLFAKMSSFFDYESISVTFLLAVDYDNPQFFEETVIKNGASVIHLHDLDRHRVIKWPWTIYRAFKQYGPFDVVHANMDMQSGMIVTMARLAGVPIRICHAHSPAHRNDSVSFFRRCYRQYMRHLVHRNATVRLACSESAGQYFYINDSFTVLPNGIDLKVYRAREAPAVRQPIRGWKIITVGRLAPEKNPFFLLDVFEQIHQKKPEAELIWVGTGRIKDEIKKEIRKKNLSNCIQLLEQQEDVKSLLEQADLFLFPSLYEAFGLSLLEAQAVGLECYVSDRVPNIIDCGKCHFLSLDSSSSEWADYIVADMETGIKTELDEQKLRQFDIRTMATRLTELYTTNNINNADKPE